MEMTIGKLLKDDLHVGHVGGGVMLGVFSAPAADDKLSTLRMAWEVSGTVFLLWVLPLTLYGCGDHLN